MEATACSPGYWIIETIDDLGRPPQAERVGEFRKPPLFVANLRCASRSAMTRSMFFCTIWEYALSSAVLGSAITVFRDARDPRYSATVLRSPCRTRYYARRYFRTTVVFARKAGLFRRGGVLGVFITRFSVRRAPPRGIQKGAIRPRRHPARPTKSWSLPTGASTFWSPVIFLMSAITSRIRAAFSYSMRAA